MQRDYSKVNPLEVTIRKSPRETGISPSLFVVTIYSRVCVLGDVKIAPSAVGDLRTPASWEWLGSKLLAERKVKGRLLVFSRAV